MEKSSGDHETKLEESCHGFQIPAQIYLAPQVGDVSELGAGLPRDGLVQPLEANEELLGHRFGPVETSLLPNDGTKAPGAW